MKKILIFTAEGAGGHMATTRALGSAFDGKYHVQAINIFNTISKFDFIRTVTFGRTTGEQFYEHNMLKKRFAFLNALHYLGKWYFRQCKKITSVTVQRCLAEHKPDLIISVVPLLDGAILHAAEKMNIPFLLIPTDLDCTNYIHDIQKPGYGKFFMTLPFEDTDLRLKLAPAKIAPTQIGVAGFPIRPDFFEPKDIAALKTFYVIPHSKPVIFLFMGSVGSDALYTFTQQLSQLKQPVHLLICVGRYAAMKDKINTIPLPAHITTTIVEFTPRISDLMAMSDLMITKAGPVSMSEAMYMNLPMLVDVTASSLAWERLNYEFITKHGFGQIITKISDVNRFTNELLQTPEKLAGMRSTLEQYPKKHGCSEVERMVARML